MRIIVFIFFFRSDLESPKISICFFFFLLLSFQSERCNAAKMRRDSQQKQTFKHEFWMDFIFTSCSGYNWGFLFKNAETTIPYGVWSELNPRMCFSNCTFNNFQSISNLFNSLFEPKCENRRNYSKPKWITVTIYAWNISNKRFLIRIHLIATGISYNSWKC